MLELPGKIKKELKKAENKEAYLMNYLYSFTVKELAKMIADDYLAENSTTPRIKLTLEQFNTFFDVKEEKKLSRKVNKDKEPKPSYDKAGKIEYGRNQNQTQGKGKI